MHSLNPYSMRCFDPNSTAQNIKDRYAKLDAIGSTDTFDLLKQFVTSKSANFHDVEDSKQVYRFDDLKIDEDKRIITGWLVAGHYGRKSDIINIKTGNVDFKKAEENADVGRHFIFLFVPKGMNEALALLHSYRSHGIKTLFYDQFEPQFRTATQLKLQMNPLTYEKAMDNWINANAKEIRLTKFTGLNDVADQIEKLGHDEVEIKLKPPRKGNFGKLKDFINKDTEQRNVVEILMPLCAQVKTTVEVDGKKRVFTIGSANSCSISEVEAPDDLVEEGGNPEREAIEKWCNEVATDLCKNMYPNMNVSP